jgi:hypothetical protein
MVKQAESISIRNVVMKSGDVESVELPARRIRSETAICKTRDVTSYRLFFLPISMQLCICVYVYSNREIEIEIKDIGTLSFSFYNACCGYVWRLCITVSLPLLCQVQLELGHGRLETIRLLLNRALYADSMVGAKSIHAAGALNCPHFLVIYIVSAASVLFRAITSTLGGFCACLDFLLFCPRTQWSIRQGWKRKIRPIDSK